MLCNPVYRNNNNLYSMETIINNNINVFNKKQVFEGKQETDFKKITKTIIVHDYEDNDIGKVLVFDNNKGYLFVDHNNGIRKESFSEGLPQRIYTTRKDHVYYYYSVFYLSLDELKSDVKEHYGKGVANHFYSHHDSTFVSEKTRTLLNDLDYEYNTGTDKSSAVFYNNYTWCTTQTANDCGPLAIANMLWSYKISNVVDLTNGALTSAALSSALESYVSYDPVTGTSTSNICNASNYFSGSGYYISALNAFSGSIESILTESPIIGFFWADNEGHFALITGRGRSVYKKIFGINFYTNWDIVNTWVATSTPNRPDKYWVDNQYFNDGFVLMNALGHIVCL